VQNAADALSSWLSRGSAWLSCKAAINRLSIPWRLGLLVLALALPLNLIIVEAIWGLVNQAQLACALRAALDGPPLADSICLSGDR
jgi:hypothetical protein